MAGTNKILKESQVLFRAGDKSDGMYIIRRGELRVYLEQDGKEVQLATIGEGGMIGEMALFDNQPRSASVKATKETEVTLISLDDFGKLMKQIPKWFVGLMSALSSRLRQTNERLQKLESTKSGPKTAGKKPYQNVLRQIHLMILLWHKDSVKDGKDWVLPKLAVEQTLADVFNEDAEKVRALVEELVKLKIFGSRLDGYKNVVLCTTNRAALGNLTAFMTAFIKANPSKPQISPALLGMLRVLERMAHSAPYDTTTIALPDLIKEGKRDGQNTVNWDIELASFASGSEDVKVVKTSSGPGLRTSKKEVSAYARNAEALAAIYKANLG